MTHKLGLSHQNILIKTFISKIKVAILDREYHRNGMPSKRNLYYQNLIKTREKKFDKTFQQ